MSVKSEIRKFTILQGEDGKLKDNHMKFAKDTIMTNNGEIFKIGAFYDRTARMPQMKFRHMKEELYHLGPRKTHISVQDLIQNEKEGALCKFKVILF